MCTVWSPELWIGRTFFHGLFISSSDHEALTCHQILPSWNPYWWWSILLTSCWKEATERSGTPATLPKLTKLYDPQIMVTLLCVAYIRFVPWLKVMTVASRSFSTSWWTWSQVTFGNISRREWEWWSLEQNSPATYFASIHVPLRSVLRIWEADLKKLKRLMRTVVLWMVWSCKLNKYYFSKTIPLA